MICFEVFHNGAKLCRAGMEELTVLTGIVAYADPNEAGDPPLTLSVGGLYINENDDNVHPSWLDRFAFYEGDEITFRVIRSSTADRPISERTYKSDDSRRQEYDYYLHLKDKFEPSNDRNT